MLVRWTVVHHGMHLLENALLTVQFSENLTGKKEVTEGNVTCRNTKPPTVDSMEVDVGTRKIKKSGSPVGTVTPPPVLAENSILSKPTSKQFTRVAINHVAEVVKVMTSCVVLDNHFYVRL